jgi:3-hydroxyacyl-CoA dehydrogenase
MYFFKFNFKYVGLDTVKFITDGWYQSSPQLKGKDIVSPSKSLNDLVAKGHFGKKTGKGFLDYTKPAKM